VQTGQTATQPPAADRANEAAAAVASLGRDDLAQRLRVAAARVTRPATIVCVVGEFKQGKSSLVNALLGTRACAVDDDLATSVVTLVHHQDPARIDVRRREGDRLVVEQVDAATAAELGSEVGNRRNERRIERIDIGIPHPLLKAGLAIVDTPGMGGIGAGHASATLAFLPYADGLIFASDATAELSGPEVEFLRQAAGLCPTVICALTKIDMAPAWRRIAELNERHLRRTGLEIPIVGVSSNLRMAAMARDDRELNVESGFAELGRLLNARVLAPAKELASQRADAEVTAVLDQLIPGLRTEASVLESPEAAAETMAALEQAKSRLEHLRGPAARWSVLVGDRMTDLSSDAGYRFRGAMRNLTQAMDERIETLKTPADWDEIGRTLTTEVSDAVANVFAGLERGAAQLRSDVAELLAEDSLELGAAAGMRAPVDVTSMWRGPSITEKGSVPGNVLGQALTGLRGAQSGIMLFGMMGTFLPAAVGALVLTAPVTLGLGAAFAGGQLLTANKRKIEQRRQRAKQAVRQFLDDVQFEVNNQLAEVVRDLQRSIRDEFTERVTELLRTYTETAQRAQADAQRDSAVRAQRLTEVRAALAKLEALRP
jgi:hypothetical protein